MGSELSPERQQAWKEWLGEYKAALKAEGQSNEQRIRMQNSANPCYIPRNHLLQKAIEQAEEGEFSEVRTLLLYSTCTSSGNLHAIDATIMETLMKQLRADTVGDSR